MPTLSLCMIVRNVERTIRTCLESIAPFVDEIVIVDTGSTDGTKVAIRQVDDYDRARGKILDFTPATHPTAFYLDRAEDYEPLLGPFTGKPILADYAGARNLGWQAATSEYLIWVDSDDVVEGGDKLRSIVEDMAANKIDTAFLTYDYLTDNQGRVILQHPRERIFKRGVGVWVGKIHEVCIPPGASKTYQELRVVHKRREWGLVPEIANRNLKVLIPWLESQPDPPDPRILYYLATDERHLWPDRALAHLKRYATISGSPDERAAAHVCAGGIHEMAERYDEALAEYAMATMANPLNPDGFFGAARIAYYKARVGYVSWDEVIAKTERGFAIKEAVSMMAADPTTRASRPYIYYSIALINLGLYDKGLIACDEGLKHFEPGTDEHAWLTKNRQKCLDGINPPREALRATLRADDPLDAPSANIPHEMLVDIALQLWKKTRETGRKADAALLLAGLPAALFVDPRIQAAKAFNQDTVPLNIVLWTGPAFEKWNPGSLGTGLGGSEIAAIHMARELQRRGHRVRVYNDCARVGAGTFDGVEYINYDKSHPFECDVLIVSRAAAAINEFGGNAKVRVLWVHDIHCGSGQQIALGLARSDRILCLSNWHKDYFCKTYPGINPKAVTVTRNGLDLDRFKGEPKKIGNRLIFSSSPDRGLDRLLDLFPVIRGRVPDAELHVYYGFKFWESVSDDHGAALARIAHYKKRMTETPGVIFHGRVGQRDLAQAFLSAKVWAYPTWFTETSCLGAMEAQAGGCVPVTTIEGALPETVKHGILIPQPDNDARYAEAFIANVVRLLSDETARKELADKGRAHSQSLGWNAVAADWEELFRADLADLSKPNGSHLPALRTATGTLQRRPLRVAVILGKFGASVHGVLDINEICDSGFRTGTVLGFLGIVWGLAELGHTIDAFCDAKEHVPNSKWSGANFYALDRATIEHSYDAYISVNEPDLLRAFPKGALKICVQWLNDFSYCQLDWNAYVDQYVLPSKTLQDYLDGTVRGKSEVIPIGTNIEFFSPEKPKRPGSVAYCSSPDRGLHHLLRIWPKVRERVPEANLRIYYRFQPWYDQIVASRNLVGTPVYERAIEIDAAFKNLADKGVTLVGPVPPKQMAAELSETRVFAYPCDTMRFSEGYSVSILDACAAGCVSIISGVDALPEVHGAAVRVIGLHPREADYPEWIDAIVEGLTDDKVAAAARVKGVAHAQARRRQAVAKLYEEFLYQKIQR